MPSTQLRNRTAIVGIGHTEFAKSIDRPEITLALEAITSALDDAGISPKEVDGLVKFTMEPTVEVEIARNLGLHNLSYFGEVGYGGGAGCGAVGHAAMAVATGAANTVVVWRARKRGSGGRPWAAKSNRVSGEFQWFLPWGLSRPVDQIAMLARRHMNEYGSTPRQLGSIAIAFREYAMNNPNATMRKPMTMDDYLNARFVSEPLRLLDCCLESDGALAVVVTSAGRAKDAPNPSALIRGFSQGTGPDHLVMANYFTANPMQSPAHFAAQDLWANAGCGPEDIDVAQFYDAFTPLVLISLEEYGFCKPADSGPFVEAGNLRKDGALPCNTSGGSLSEAYVHGMNLIVEAVRQIRGSSVNQIANVNNVLVTSGNGVPTSSLVLGAA